MWAGAKVHDCIERTLTNLQRGISVLDVDQIIDITLNQMREEFRSSREKRYHTHPKTCALFEHEYEVQISDADWKKTADNMEQCLRNFYDSETFAMLKELPRKMWLEVEDFSSFYLNNTKIWAVLDCSFRGGLWSRFPLLKTPQEYLSLNPGYFTILINHSSLNLESGSFR